MKIKKDNAYIVGLFVVALVVCFVLLEINLYSNLHL
jgi:hypothetical protein